MIVETFFQTRTGLRGHQEPSWGRSCCYCPSGRRAGTAQDPVLQRADQLAGHLEGDWTQRGLPLTPPGAGWMLGEPGLLPERWLRSNAHSMPAGNQASLAVLLAEQLLRETRCGDVSFLWLLQLLNHSCACFATSGHAQSCTHLAVQIAFMFWNNSKKKSWPHWSQQQDSDGLPIVFGFTWGLLAYSFRTTSIWNHCR